MNYMSEVAKMLGVELGEEFEIIFPENPSCHATALLNSEGLYIKEHNIANQDYWKISALTNLLNGSYTIKRKPWRPKYYEKYYSIGADGLEPGTWLNDFIDDTLYKIGNCYRTEEEARADSDKWKAFYASDEVLEV